MVLRHRSRHLLGTMFAETRTGLTTAGWVTTPVNFGTTAVTLVDYQPMERDRPIVDNTVAVSFGESPSDEDAEMGAGLRSAWYPVFVDAYMVEEAHVIAICDDIREIFDGRTIQLVDQGTGLAVPGWSIDVEETLGPEKASAFMGALSFKAHWRSMKLGCRLFYGT